MGVKQLWKLLLPVARRVDIATLSGKVVAVDASIWMIQFVKAMRDSNGEMIMNAHLLGTFRRVCRLLFHRIRPIFVFDGGTPALKRRTVLMRNERREAQGAKLRKAAQRLLMLQFEKSRIEARRKKDNGEDEEEGGGGGKSRGFSAVSRRISSSTVPPSAVLATAIDLSEKDDDEEEEKNDEEGELEHAIQMSLETAEERGAKKEEEDEEDDGPVSYQRRKVTKKSSVSMSVANPIDLDLPPILPPPSWSRLRVGKGGGDDEDDDEPLSSLGIGDQDREALSVMEDHFFRAEQAANLADEEAVDKAIKRRKLARVVVENDDMKEEEDANAVQTGPGWLPIVPSSTKDVDLSVIASLPGYLQKEYISALQTRVRQENRGTLLPMAADPDAFSKTQLSAYLKTSDLNLRIEKMNAEAASKQSDGKRIASEANRQYLLIKEDDQPNEGAGGGLFFPSSSSSSSSSNFSASSALVGSGELSDREKAVLFLSRGSGSSSSISKRGVTFHSFSGAFTGSGSGLRGGGGGSRGAWRGGRGGGGRKPAPITLASISKVRDKRVQGMLDALDPGGAAGKISVGMRELTQPERASMGLSGLITGGNGKEGEEKEDTEIVFTEDGARLERRIRVTKKDDDDDDDDDDYSVSGDGKKTKKKNKNKEEGENDLTTTSLFRFERGEAESAAAAAAAIMGDNGAYHNEAREEGGALRVAGITQRGALDYASQFKLSLPTASGAVDLDLKEKKEKEEEEEVDRNEDHLQQQDLVSSLTDDVTMVITNEEGNQGLDVIVVEPSDEEEEALAIKMSLDYSSYSGDQQNVDTLDKGEEEEDWEDVADDPPLIESKREDDDDDDAIHLRSKREEALKWLYVDPAAISSSDSTMMTNDELADKVPPSTLSSNNGVSMNSSSSSSSDIHSVKHQEAIASALATAGSMASWADSAMRRALKSMHVPVPAHVLPISSSSSSRLVSSSSSSSSSSSPSVLVPSSTIIQASPEITPSDPIQESTEIGLDLAVVKKHLAESVDDDNVHEIHEDEEEEGDDDEEEQLALIMSVQKELLEGETSLPGAIETSSSPPMNVNSSSAMNEGLSEPFSSSSSSLREPITEILQSSQAARGVAQQQQQQQQQQEKQLQQQEQQRRQAALDLERRKKDDSALDSIRAEEARLRLQSGTAARDSDGVTAAMRDEVMALLQLFGVPFVVAPMEAEAQCAALEAAGIVDAVITDDSDAFLFGAKSVFKNIFEDKKYVEVYRAEDVEKELGLDRQDLIRAALLLGSDYTSGVKGVGIVNAAEILHAFPGDEGLDSFRTWLNDLPLENDLDEALKGGKPSKSALSSMSRVDRFKALHRTQRKTWEVGSGFPNRAVLAAYRNPTITAIEKAAISWHAPNVEGLRLAAREKFGWPANKTDDLLLPVLHELTSTSKQKTIDSYMKTYADNVHVAAIKSKRLKTAVKGLTGNSDLGVIALDDYEDVLGAGIGGISSNEEDATGVRFEKERTQGRGGGGGGASAVEKKTKSKSIKKTTIKKKSKKRKRLRRIESSSEDSSSDSSEEEERKF